MMQNFFSLLVLAILAQTAQAWNNYSYYGYNNYGGYGGYYNNRYNNGGITYTGTAFQMNAAGDLVLVPVSQCEFECAMDNTCGTESQCAVGAIVGYVFLGIFGLCCLIGCICACIHCWGSSNNSSPAYVEPLLDSDRKQPGDYQDFERD